MKFPGTRKRNSFLAGGIGTTAMLRFIEKAGHPIIKGDFLREELIPPQNFPL
jgi:hypothetical protein